MHEGQTKELAALLVLVSRHVTLLKRAPTQVGTSQQQQRGTASTRGRTHGSLAPVKTQREALSSHLQRLPHFSPNDEPDKVKYQKKP